MMRQGRYVVFALLVSILSGCLGGLWTGASLVYDRHSVYKKINDYQLFVDTNDVLAINKTFARPGCVIDIGVFNGDILLAGHLPSEDMLDDLRQRMTKVKGYRRLFNGIKVMQATSNSVQDSWITTKIRSQIFADDSIDPNAFKIITSDRVVYLMGDVKPEEAEKVVKIARVTQGVEKVVKIFKYFTYQPK